MSFGTHSVLNVYTCMSLSAKTCHQHKKLTEPNTLEFFNYKKLKQLLFCTLNKTGSPILLIK